MKTSTVLVWLMFFIYSGSTHGNAVIVHQWEVCTFSYMSSRPVQNPYAEIPINGGEDLLKVVFTGISGDAQGKSYTIIAFWKGSSQWNVNFAAPYCGKWRYVSKSSDKSMNGKKGEFDVIPWSEDEKKSNPVRHGFIRVRMDGETAGHFFEYSDAHPFLWIGDTWW